MIDSPLAVVRASLPVLRGAAVLDVGCGDGGLAQALATEGAIVTGIDPNPRSIDSARLRTPDCRFDHGSAAALPYADAAFDAVVFVNSLHHVPEDQMDQALHEAWRVLRAGAPLLVIEPLTQGSCFDALRTIEDETQIRRAAQDALLRVAAGDMFKAPRTLSYTRRELFADIDSFLARVIRVDPARHALVNAKRDTISDTVLALAQRSAAGELVLDQPHKADILHAAK